MLVFTTPMFESVECGIIWPKTRYRSATGSCRY